MREASSWGAWTRYREVPDPVAVRAWQQTCSWARSAFDKSLPVLRWIWRVLKVVFMVAGVALGAVGAWSFISKLPERPWLMVAILVALWLFACHKSDRVAVVSGVTFVLAFFAIPVAAVVGLILFVISLFSGS